MSAFPGAPVDPAQSNSETLPLRSMVGEFEILGIIGEGGFGTVYLAMDHSLNRKVALKEYRPAALATRTATTVVLRSQRHAEAFAAGLKSFINEARTLARFDHPALVRVYRFWQENGTAYMAMPLVAGSTLTSIVRDRRPSVTESWLRQILAPLLDAIEALHGVQIYHRDIAPDNVLIQQNGTPVLLDFGAAREIVAAQTQALTVILKPGYAPVEQYAEDAGMKQGPWTDIYAIGAVMQFAVIGRAPPNSVTRLMNDSRVPLLQEMPAGFTAEFLGAIDKALTVRPEARPQSIAELRELFGMMRGSGSESSTGFSLHPNAPASSPTQFGGGLAGHVPPPADETTIILPGKHEPIPATETREPAMGAAPGSALEATPGRTPTGTAEAPVPERRRSKAPLLWGAAAVVVLVVAGIAMRGMFKTQPPAAEPASSAGAPAESTPAAPPAAGTTATESVTKTPAIEPASPNKSAAQSTEPPTGPNTAAGATTGAPPATEPAKAASDKPAQGTVRLSIKPWAMVSVDGEEKGVSPPLKSVTLPVGKHTIQLTNPNFPPYMTEVEVVKDQRIALSYGFN